MKIFYCQLVSVLITLIMFPFQSVAEERWRVIGAELVFNMNIPYPDEPDSDELIARNATEFALFVMENPQIEVIAVSGDGGYGPSSVKISETILEFNFNTCAFGECLSACTWIFLAGSSRTLSQGASLGFHRPYVIGEEERAYYISHRQSRSWENEFDYVEFIYDVGLIDMLEIVDFMTSRGVSFEFIRQAYSVDSFQMWQPTREILMKNGVITAMTISWR